MQTQGHRLKGSFGLASGTTAWGCAFRRGVGGGEGSLHVAALERSRVLPRKLERGINPRPCHSCQLLARRGSRRWGGGPGGGVSEQGGLESWQIRIRGTGGERFCQCVQSQGDPWGHREKQPADTET